MQHSLLIEKYRHDLQRVSQELQAPVLDLACGHGLLAHIMLILDNSSNSAVAVDKKIPLNAEKLSKSLISTWPRLKNRIIYKQVPIREITILPDDIVVSAHACGALTDLIIDRAIEQRARVAVLPCCHNLKESSTYGLECWMDKTLAVDTIRAMKLRSKGYRIVTRIIPDDITPKNRLLMGEHLKRQPVEKKKAQNSLYRTKDR